MPHAVLLAIETSVVLFFALLADLVPLYACCRIRLLVGILGFVQARISAFVFLL